MGDWPVDKQVLLHPETLRPGVALGSVLGPTWLGKGFAWLVVIALQLGELQHLVLFDAAEVPCLLPHPWCVNHESILEIKYNGNVTWCAFMAYSSLLDCFSPIKNRVSNMDCLKTSNNNMPNAFALLVEKAYVYTACISICLLVWKLSTYNMFCTILD